MKDLLLKIKGKFAKPAKAIPSSTSINPHKHWGMFLHIFFYIVFLLIIFSFYLLYKIKNDQIFQVTPSSSDGMSLLKEDLLKKVLKSFSDKKESEDKLKANPPAFQDPSI